MKTNEMIGLGLRTLGDSELNLVAGGAGDSDGEQEIVITASRQQVLDAQLAYALATYQVDSGIFLSAVGGSAGFAALGFVLGGPGGAALGAGAWTAVDKLEGYMRDSAIEGLADVYYQNIRAGLPYDGYAGGYPIP